MRRKIILLSCLVFFILAAPVQSFPTVKLPTSWPQEAFASYGSSQEIVTGTLQADTNPRLSIESSPPFKNQDSLQDHYIILKLLNSNGNAYLHVTYDIQVERAFSTFDKEISSTSLHERFHSHSGFLGLNIQPGSNVNSQETTIIGAELDPSLDMWIVDEGGNVTLSNVSLFDEPGLYHFHVQVLGINHDSTLLPKPEVFDAWLSLGEAVDLEFSHGQSNYNSTVISYIDRIERFDFDPEARRFTWKAAFDFKRLETDNLFVHEEIMVPKAFMQAINSSSFAGSINGYALNAGAIAVDPYSTEYNYNVHFLISKETLIKLDELQGSSLSKDEIPRDRSSLDFALLPGHSSDVRPGFSDVRTSFSIGGISTDNAKVVLVVNFVPSQLAAVEETKINLSFYKPGFSGPTPFNGDVHYELQIFDSDGNQLIDLEHLVAENSMDSNIVDLAASDNYRLKVNVVGVEEEGRELDRSYAGVATEMIAIPEFSDLKLLLPISAILVLLISVFTAMTKSFKSAEPRKRI